MLIAGIFAFPIFEVYIIRDTLDLDLGFKFFLTSGIHRTTPSFVDFNGFAWVIHQPYFLFPFPTNKCMPYLNDSFLFVVSSPNRARTCDTAVMEVNTRLALVSHLSFDKYALLMLIYHSRVLCQLSYRGILKSFSFFLTYIL